MAVNGAGASLDCLISSFNTRISELQQLVIARNMYPASSIADLAAIETALKAMELQIQAIEDRVREESEAIHKAKKLIHMSLRQQKKLQSMSSYVPSSLPDRRVALNLDTNNNSMLPEIPDELHGFGTLKIEEEPAPLPKGKKGRSPPPAWYISADELYSLPSYMRGRLTLDKVNAAINDMVAYAEANVHLIGASKKKLAENLWERALEVRDIAMTEAVKGKHFFLESDIKGPTLKLDNTGKAILTVLRHLGRITETRIKHHRVLILLKP